MHVAPARAAGPSSAASATWQTVPGIEVITGEAPAAKPLTNAQKAEWMRARDDAAAHPSSLSHPYVTGGGVVVRPAVNETALKTAKREAASSRVPTNQKYVDGAIARNVAKAEKQGPCIIHGDSGGPVYNLVGVEGAAPKGIISGAGGGGSDNYGGALDPCQVYFTDIWRAVDAWGGYVMTR